MNKQTTVQTKLIHDTDKDNAAMSLEQLNEYLVKRSAVICEYARKKRQVGYTSDIIPPICYIDVPLQKNIDNVLACFSNTLAAALSSETRYIQALQSFEALSNIVESEKYLIFDFLSENGLAEKFNEYVKSKK